MIKELTKLASHLDSKGLMKEADALDEVILKLSQQELLEEGFEFPDPSGLESVTEDPPADPEGLHMINAEPTDWSRTAEGWPERACLGSEMNGAPINFLDAINYWANPGLGDGSQAGGPKYRMISEGDNLTRISEAEGQTIDQIIQKHNYVYRHWKLLDGRESRDEACDIRKPPKELHPEITDPNLIMAGLALVTWTLI